MRFVPFILIDIAVAFLAFTAYTIYAEGFVEVWDAMNHSLWTWQMTGDIALGLCSSAMLMVLDSRRSGIRVAPYLLATLLLGGPGPVLYLARRFYLINKA